MSQIIVHYYISWNINGDANDTHIVDDCGSGDHNDTLGNLTCSVGCTGNIGALDFPCSRVDVSENEATGEGTLISTLMPPGLNYFEAMYVRP